MGRSITGQAGWGFLRVLRFDSPPSGTFNIKHHVFVTVLMKVCTIHAHVGVRVASVGGALSVVTMGTAPIKVLLYYYCYYYYYCCHCYYYYY